MHPRGSTGFHATCLMLAAAFVLAPLCERASGAVTPDQAERAGDGLSTSTAERSDDGIDRRTLRRLPLNLARGAAGLFHPESLRLAVPSVGAVGFASVWDDEEAADPSSGFGEALETAGGWPSAVAVAGLFAAGRVVHEPRLRAMSYDLLNTAIVNVGYTALLKTIVRRERPDRSNDSSFPSGHASNAFALATVVQQHYGWPAGAPAYMLAAAIGVSRVVRDRHFLSDVAAGAALGCIVARSVVRMNGGAARATGRGAVVGVAPSFGAGERGVRIAVSF